MSDVAARMPVIVGVGFQQERYDDPTRSSEAYRLMVQAARNAAADAGVEELLARIESISIPQGLWPYRNPGKLVADELGDDQWALQRDIARVFDPLGILNPGKIFTR